MLEIMVYLRFTDNIMKMGFVKNLDFMGGNLREENRNKKIIKMNTKGTTVCL